MSNMLRACVVVALSLGVICPAVAADRYYLPPGAAGGAIVLIDDQPVSLALARCYGRYTAMADPYDFLGKPEGLGVPKDIGVRIKTIGDALVATARAERSEAVALDALVPPKSDEDTGEPIPPSGPPDVYEAYWRGHGDIFLGTGSDFGQMPPDAQKTLIRKIVPELLSACSSLQSDLAAGRNLGEAREPVVIGTKDGLLDGQPRALVLARCAGRLTAFREYLDQAAGEGHEGADYPSGLVEEWKSTAEALERTAARDRNQTFVYGDFGKPGDPLPPALSDADRAGRDDVGGFDFRPDFWMANPEEAIVREIHNSGDGARESCAAALKSITP